MAYLCLLESQDRKELRLVPGAGAVVGTVGELRQYPGKSMQGYEVRTLQVQGARIVGDHEIAVVDEDGRVITAKQAVGVPLLSVTAEAASVRGETWYWMHVPDPDPFLCAGWHHDPQVLGALCRLLGTRVRIVKIEDASKPKERIDKSPVRADTFVDEVDVHLVTMPSVRLAETATKVEGVVRRMRPQVVIETVQGILPLAEERWVGSTMRIGDEVELRLDNCTVRCALPGRPQPDLPAAPGLLKWLHGFCDNRFGLSASVIKPGVVQHGDIVAPY